MQLTKRERTFPEIFHNKRQRKREVQWDSLTVRGQVGVEEALARSNRAPAHLIRHPSLTAAAHTPRSNDTGFLQRKRNSFQGRRLPSGNFYLKNPCTAENWRNSFHLSGDDPWPEGKSFNPMAMAAKPGPDLATSGFPARGTTKGGTAYLTRKFLYTGCSGCSLID